MSKPLLTLWCDSATNRLVSGWQSATPAPDPILIRGDNLGVEIHWVSTITSSTASMVEIPFPPSATVTLALGAIDSVPSDGTFTLTYGANTTGDLAYNISATDLATALNSLASITAEGGVSVSKFGISYKVVWNDPGLRTTDLEIGATNLFPSSYGESTVSKAGDSVTNHTVILTLRRTPIAACTSFTTLPDPTVSVDTVLPGTWRVSFDNPPRTGTFTLTLTVVLASGATQTITTQPIPATAAATDIYAALSNATLTNNVFNVSVSGQASWDISADADFASGLWTETATVSAVSGDSAAIGFSSVYGVLNLNTAEIEEFMSGLDSASTVLAVNVDSDGTRQTILQTGVTIDNQLISNATFTVVDMGTVMPVDSVVRYDTSQSLTSPQKATARANIGAAAATDLTGFETRLDTQETQTNSIIANYLMSSTAAATYAPIDDPTFTGVVTIPSGALIDGYLTTANAASTYLTISTASSTYAPKAAPTFTGLVTVSSSGIRFNDGTTQTTAAVTPDLTPYLLSTTAASTYLSIANAPTIYLSKSGNLSGLTDLATARTNLGLGTMAVETASNYLAKSGNLSGLTNTATARTNLGLGSTSDVTFASVTFSGNSSVQSIAGPPAPTDTTKPYLPVWNGSAWDTTNILPAGQFFYNAGGHCADFGTSIGNDLGPAIRVSSNEFTSWTEMFSGGIRFPDGTLQTTASNKRFVDYTAYEWSQTLTSGTVTENVSGVGKSITVGVASSTFYGAKLRFGTPIFPYSGKSYTLFMDNGFYGTISQRLLATCGLHKIINSTQTLILGRQAVDVVRGVTEWVYLNSSGNITTVDDIPLFSAIAIEVRSDGYVFLINEDGDKVQIGTDAETNFTQVGDIYWVGGNLSNGTYYGQPDTFTCGQISAYCG